MKGKICGVNRLEDALHASACGAEMLGFNFYPKSPRYIAPERAREIIAALPRSVETVGVFVNESSPARVREIAEYAGLRSLQLHGDEDVEYCAALQDLNVIKALRVDSAFGAERVAPFSQYRILLDAPSKSYGGSGEKFDWTLVQKVRPLVKYLMLAGGLGVENVDEAL